MHTLRRFNRLILMPLTQLSRVDEITEKYTKGNDRYDLHYSTLIYIINYLLSDIVEPLKTVRIQIVRLLNLEIFNFV